MSVARRVRPWLGTFVEMRVEGLRERKALEAIDLAFEEVATIHRLMSFHSSESDLSRLHRTQPGNAVRVDARTSDVIQCALRVAHVSNGCFDPTVAARQVARGYLPRPRSAFEPDPDASWTDIELLDDLTIRLKRALWIDLGGIAKGYAVDRAIEILRSAGAQQMCVNAGGDLRIAGECAEIVYLSDQRRHVEIADAALASSTANDSRRSVSVVAPECIIADALTKVILGSNAQQAEQVLAHFSAQACTQNDVIAPLLDAA
jgi:FAD:protein FMN transferase